MLWAYWTSPRSAIGETSFKLIYDSAAVILIEVRMKTHMVLNYNEDQNSELIKENLVMLGEVREETRVTMEKYKSKIKVMYNRHVKPKSFKKCELVLRRADTLKPTCKLEPH